MLYLVLILLVSGCVTGQVVDKLNETSATTTTTINITTAVVPSSSNSSGEETAKNMTLLNQPINISITSINPKEEWVEIKNNGPEADIKNWTIFDKANHRYVFAGTLSPNASMKLHTGHGIDNSTDIYWNYKISVWNDDGDTAILADSSSKIIHIYSYSKTNTAKTSTPTTSTISAVTSSTTTITTSSTISTTTSSTSETTTTTTTTTGHVMLGEVYYDPLGNEAKEEWIKLYNPTGAPIDLANWTISDNSGVWKFPAVIIRSASNLTIARNFTAFQNMTGCSPDVSGFTRSLNNDGDQLFLNNPAGSEIDFVAWEDGFNNTYPAWNTSAPEGKSLRRISLADTDTIADWAEGEAHPC